MENQPSSRTVPTPKTVQKVGSKLKEAIQAIKRSPYKKINATYTSMLINYQANSQRAKIKFKQQLFLIQNLIQFVKGENDFILDHQFVVTDLLIQSSERSLYQNEDRAYDFLVQARAKVSFASLAKARLLIGQFLELQRQSRKLLKRKTRKLKIDFTPQQIKQRKS